ncbi:MULTISPECIES: DUF6745 domain-containing protein [Actinoalloteichus]|uniref:DUF6745 domain-containing protein n=1 Tax=Actinoalloteichus TaxID=65496 RepID=UPI0009513246|nr:MULTISPECIES: hypothetical protein [Actinoalloteichus]
MRDLDHWQQAVDLRTQWLNHALCTDPADRRNAEDAVTGLYALLGRPRPAFVWVDSPAAAVPSVASQHTVSPHGAQPWESGLASLVSTLRHRIDARIGAVDPDDWPRPPALPDPVAALRSGTGLSPVLDQGVLGALRRGVRQSVANVIRSAIPERFGLAWYGQHEVDWVARHDVHQRIHGRPFDATDGAQWELWATLVRSCGWWWPREDVCVLAERPSAVHTEPAPDDVYGEIRLHAADGPAVVYPDGWGVYSWHGTRVPAWVIEDPTVEAISAESNVEVRRCAIERIGWAAFIERAGLTLVGRSVDPGNSANELRLYDLPYRHRGSTTRLLLAVNGSVERDGTRRQYGLHVPPWFDDPIDAAGWTYGLSGAQYAGLQRRT